jgi:hypothetical protein
MGGRTGVPEEFSGHCRTCLWFYRVLQHGSLTQVCEFNGVSEFVKAPKVRNWFRGHWFPVGQVYSASQPRMRKHKGRLVRQEPLIAPSVEFTCACGW